MYDDAGLRSMDGVGRSTVWIVVVAMACTVLSGCSLQKMTVRQTADVLWNGQKALEGESDPAFAREAIPGNLMTVETFLATDPGNEKMLRMLAKGHFSYTFAFVEGDLERAQVERASEERIETLKESAVKGYLKSRGFGMRLLDEEFRKAALNLEVEKVKKMLGEMDEDDVPGLFWTAYGWGSAANLAQNDSDMVAALPIVEAMMNRVIELDEEFFFSGPHTFFGVYYASRPPMFGGDPEKAKVHFEKAMEQNGDRNLMIPFLYARFYATQVQDKELFDRLLNGMREVDVTKYENVRLNNEVALERAEYWEARVGELFYELDEPEPEDAPGAQEGDTGGFGEGGGFEEGADAPDADETTEEAESPEVSPDATDSEQSGEGADASSTDDSASDDAPSEETSTTEDSATGE
jgi:hypothetical protein